jgi:hypothetical protein
MISGGQEFALIVIGMAMFSGVLRTSILARHGMPHLPGMRGRRGRRNAIEDAGDDGSVQVETLKRENRRLTDQVETMQDRLIVLEKIVTDRSYGLADEIEALRDRTPASRKEVQ